MLRWLTFLLAVSLLAQGQTGKGAYEDFSKWRGSLPWDEAVRNYEAKLRANGLSATTVERTMRAIDSYGEAELYDKVYNASPSFNTRPNELLAAAVKSLRPGAALDVGMGQGRNSLFLARRGWSVTGFDVSRAGLSKAQAAAAAQGLKIDAVHSSDEDFDFGQKRWDLIAIIYAVEKRSVVRARDALRLGGVVVVEAGHKSASGAPFEYDSGELRRIFAGFKVLHDEEVTAVPDWTKDRIRVVRFVAQRPNGTGSPATSR